MSLKISADQINRRLGGSGNQSNRSGGYEPQPVHIEEDEDGNSVALYAGMFATFIAIGGATFFWDSLPIPSFSTDWNRNSFVSVADPICKPMWQAHAWNSDAVACYLVEKPDRYCDPQERAHLVEVFTQYRTDIEMAKAAAIHQVTFEKDKIYNDIVDSIERQEKGLPPKKSTKKSRPKNKYLPNMSFEDSIADYQKKVFNPSARGSNADLSSMMRKILEKGYFKSWEFGIIRDQIVQEAMVPPLPEIKSPCKTDEG